MLEAMKTLVVSRAAQRVALPAQALLDPFGGLPLAGLRARNTMLDGFFYDVSAIAPEEALSLGADVAEGTILVVPPAGEGSILVCEHAEDFAANGGAGVPSLCVAGVGSSALGSAALARNVADATGQPAAAVVSGYGTADFLTEALGGWLLFGTVNRFRHHFELVEPSLPSWPGSAVNLGLVRKFIDVPRLVSEDVQAVLALLLRPGLSFRLVVGHSKGNLVVAEALSALVGADPQPAAVDVIQRIVTLSAAIYMPDVFAGRIVDVMGQWDALGLLNSSPGIDIDLPVPEAGHHTNTRIPAHLPVRSVLEALGPVGAGA